MDDVLATWNGDGSGCGRVRVVVECALRAVSPGLLIGGRTEQTIFEVATTFDASLAFDKGLDTRGPVAKGGALNTGEDVVGELEHPVRFVARGGVCGQLLEERLCIEGEGEATEAAQAVLVGELTSGDEASATGEFELHAACVEVSAEASESGGPGIGQFADKAAGA